MSNRLYNQEIVYGVGVADGVGLTFGSGLFFAQRNCSPIFKHQNSPIEFLITSFSLEQMRPFKSSGERSGVGVGVGEGFGVNVGVGLGFGVGATVDFVEDFAKTSTRCEASSSLS